MTDTAVLAESARNSLYFNCLKHTQLRSQSHGVYADSAACSFVAPLAALWLQGFKRFVNTLV